MANAWDRVADVIVVGSGGAALVAATLAADGGCDVLVLEKAQQIGGTTAVSGGGVWIPCNHHMAKLGVADSREEALAYIRALTRGSEPDAALLPVYVDGAREMIAYLEAHTPLRMFPTARFTDYYAPYGVPGAKDMLWFGLVGVLVGEAIVVLVKLSRIMWARIRPDKSTSSADDGPQGLPTSTLLRKGLDLSSLTEVTGDRA